jgi:hypothetical protein
MRKLLAAIFCASALAAQGSDDHLGAVNMFVPKGRVLITPVISAVPGSLTAAEVGKAIAAAVASSTFEWMPKLTDEGTIEARLLVRTHKLVVDIAYNETKYTINYKSSENLYYSEGFAFKKSVKYATIHENCEVWLRSLDTGIQRGLQAAAIQKALTSPSES